jgi:hypothetical protein
MENNKYTEAEHAYKQIIKVMNKYKDICNIDVSDIEYKSKFHLFGIKLKEVYGLDINPKSVRSLDWISLHEYVNIGLYGHKYRRTIGISDTGEQPEDELLLVIHFSTGPYTFSEDYPVDFFYKFFKELIDLKPKYTDIRNNSLYFTMETASNAFNNFKLIYDKYLKLNEEDYKKRKIQKMKEELEKLECSQAV